MNKEYYAHMSRKYSDIEHHGVKGQQKGVRRYQNEDGSYTEEGRRHYGIGDPKKYFGSAPEAADNKAIARYNSWQNVVPPSQRASHGTYNAIKREAEEAMQRQHDYTVERNKRDSETRTRIANEKARRAEVLRKQSNSSSVTSAKDKDKVSKAFDPKTKVNEDGSWERLIKQPTPGTQSRLEEWGAQKRAEANPLPGAVKDAMENFSESVTEEISKYGIHPYELFEVYDSAVDYVKEQGQLVNGVISDFANSAYQTVTKMASEAIDNVKTFLSRLFDKHTVSTRPRK